MKKSLVKRRFMSSESPDFSSVNEGKFELRASCPKAPPSLEYRTIINTSAFPSIFYIRLIDEAEIFF